MAADEQARRRELERQLLDAAQADSAVPDVGPVDEATARAQALARQMEQDHARRMAASLYCEECRGRCQNPINHSRRRQQAEQHRRHG